MEKRKINTILGQVEDTFNNIERDLDELYRLKEVEVLNFKVSNLREHRDLSIGCDGEQRRLSHYKCTRTTSKRQEVDETIGYLNKQFLNLK